MPIRHEPSQHRPVRTIPIFVMMAISVLSLVPAAVLAASHCDDAVSSEESIQGAIDAASEGDTICVGPVPIKETL